MNTSEIFAKYENSDYRTFLYKAVPEAVRDCVDTLVSFGSVKKEDEDLVYWGIQAMVSTVLVAHDGNHIHNLVRKGVEEVL